MTFPGYPAEAFEGLSEGQVTLEFTIDEEGFVREPRVLESTRPTLDGGPGGGRQFPLRPPVRGRRVRRD